VAYPSADRRMTSLFKHGAFRQPAWSIFSRPATCLVSTGNICFDEYLPESS
jgi:hypothetical protein